MISFRAPRDYGTRFLFCHEVLRTVGAEFVGFGHFAFAIGTAGMQIAFAVWAEVEASADQGGTARAGIRQRLAHLKIENESDREKWPGEQHAEQGPEHRIHVAAFRVAIDIA